MGATLQLLAGDQIVSKSQEEFIEKHKEQSFLATPQDDSSIVEVRPQIEELEGVVNTLLSIKDQKTEVQPSKIMKIVNRHNRSFEVGRKQDAHECLDILLNIFAKLPKSQQVFMGACSPRQTCFVCDDQTQCDIEEFNGLTLPVAPTINEAMKQYFEDEILDGQNKVYCERCQNKTKTGRVRPILLFPSTLFLIMMRYGLEKKNCRPINIERKLYIPDQLSVDGENASYTLQGIVIHQGRNCHSGHYTALVRDDNDGDDDWVYCDDEVVCRVRDSYLNTNIIKENCYILRYILSSHQKKLEIRQETLSSDTKDPDFSKNSYLDKKTRKETLSNFCQ
ncbi:ubiquitin carboxyl-terminal hydrolase 9 [Exaiptasia diaphana]|uniref:Ubiquitin carboxyl-terminal hydrolase 36 n=1 Tax=Exaiptasia diaphana TaxID=2652724 RepID=A0A913XX20_EXADI|nr:ubiquitin carboxyl-terminal hydrolase 9 [Exaiptasia diaphana]XP_020911231.1 ubiquitin carboxyl-terminal hydrolase 9 [Exaiptasia diaphana]